MFLRRKNLKNWSSAWCSSPGLKFAVIFESRFLNVVLLVLVGSLAANVGRFLRQAGIRSLKPAQDNGKAQMVELVLLTSSGGIRFSCWKAVSS